MTSFENELLLFIAMSHARCGLMLCTVTKNSNNILTRACLGKYLALKNVYASTPFLLSIKPCLKMTSFGNVLLLFIAMTHAKCGFKLITVTKNSVDILTRACLGRQSPQTCSGMYPTCQPNVV